MSASLRRPKKAPACLNGCKREALSEQGSAKAIFTFIAVMILLSGSDL
jgi:hypothetical protein